MLAASVIKFKLVESAELITTFSIPNLKSFSIWDKEFIPPP